MRVERAGYLGVKSAGFIEAAAPLEAESYGAPTPTCDLPATSARGLLDAATEARMCPPRAQAMVRHTYLRRKAAFVSWSPRNSATPLREVSSLPSGARNFLLLWPSPPPIVLMVKPLSCDF